MYLSFGALAPHAEAVLAAGAALYGNAGDCAVAVAHAAAGATAVVVQGSDAGGHTHETASAFALVPQARDALDAAGHGATLLVAAGGVSDGRGLAGALALGADAAVLGTRLAAAEESLYTEAQKDALVRVACGAEGTTLGRWIDEVRSVVPDMTRHNTSSYFCLEKVHQVCSRGTPRNSGLEKVHQDCAAEAHSEAPALDRRGPRHR